MLPSMIQQITAASLPRPAERADERMARSTMSLREYRQRQREFQTRGSDLPHAKLDEATVKAAREEYERARYALRYINAHYSIAGLARKYGVSPGAMEKALNYSTWGHV